VRSREDLSSACPPDRTETSFPGVPLAAFDMPRMLKVGVDNVLNDADRLGRDPAMRWIVGGRAVTEHAASTSQMGRLRRVR
jgi:hypothetical protein